VDTPAKSVAVHQAANRLREQILAAADTETLLGSEEDVARMLGISKPTLRQVARVLEAEQILIVKRGVNGGFFARRPTADGVVQTASVYLRSSQTTYLQMFNAMAVVTGELARLAAANPDVHARAGVLEFVNTHATVPVDNLSLKAFAFGRVELCRVIGALAENPPLLLFLDVLIELLYTPSFMSIYLGHDEIIRTIRYERSLARAIRDGKPELAERVVRRQTGHTLQWFENHEIRNRLVEAPQRTTVSTSA